MFRLLPRRVSAWVLVLLWACTSVPAAAAAGRTRVLFVGGDWKAQLPNYRGAQPMRGHFVRRAVEQAAPGKFDFTLWTSYEFLQYGEGNSLRQFDVLVVGDTMGQSVVPRLVRAVTRFVEGGGGLWYCDNHKAFSFNTKALSFDAVLPIEVRPFRPYDPNASQPQVPSTKESPLRVRIAAADHPIVRGLDWSSAPALGGARYGKVKRGSTVLATSPDGTPIWVARRKGKGRALWTGGVFANDELSADFAKWAQFGRFYAQALSWLAAGSSGQPAALRSATADGTVSVDLARTGPTVTSRHFGIHGQEDAPGGSRPMKDADLALYRQLKLDGTFARTSAFQAIRQRPGGGRFDFLDDGTDITKFDWSKYDFTKADVVLADLKRIDAEPLFLYWCPWKWTNTPLDPKRYTKYFAAAIEHVNGTPGTPAYRPRLRHFEIMNEPNLSPADKELPRYAAFFNYAAGKLRKRYPGVEFGCGGFYEWPYIQQIIDRCGANLDWISRHPYGLTGEAVFRLHDEFRKHAERRVRKDLRFIITEWDFWIYGKPAFDYIMQRWKPLLERADVCIGTLHYRWREYHEGGYVFGAHGEFDQRYGELPPDWPNPGRDKPITYRYNAFWIMRDCRGRQYAAELAIPSLARCESQRAYAAATCDAEQFNIVVHYGYPFPDPAAGKVYDRLSLRVRSAIPPAVKGRTLTVSRANCKTIVTEPARTIRGDTVDLELVLPACSATSITVR
jgi:uncharacterized membrane protein